MGSWRRHAWWGLFGLGVLIALLGIGDLVVGPEFDAALLVAIGGTPLADLASVGPAYRAIDFGIRSGGLDFALVGTLFAVIAAIPLRGGQRWAWRTMWLLPTWMATSFVFTLAYGLAPGQDIPASSASGPVLALIAVALLVVAPRGALASEAG